MLASIRRHACSSEEVHVRRKPRDFRQTAPIDGVIWCDEHCGHAHGHSPQAAFDARDDLLALVGDDPELLGERQRIGSVAEPILTLIAAARPAALRQASLISGSRCALRVLIRRRAIETRLFGRASRSIFSIGQRRQCR